jgi:GT2 family glycosyltransferase
MRKDVSILIPTHGRPRKLCASLRALAQQTADPARIEILVGFDGSDEAGAAAARDAWASGGGRAELALVQCERKGYNAARNRLLERASGRVLLSLNDDVIPAPGLVEAHVRAQNEAAAQLGLPGAVIVGRSPWVIPEADTLFDRLVRETPMIFFYDVMGAATGDRWRNWGFRHAWGLNLSAPVDLVREAGGFTAFPLAYGYDDIELAWRLEQRGLPVLYRPEAEAAHDHRYLPRDVLARERRLGEAAWLFAGANPAFARAVFGRDITSEDEIAYARAFVQREAPDVERLRARFCSLAEIPADVVQGPHAATALDAISQQHVLLKRWEWRGGLLAAAEASSCAAREPAADAGSV